MGINKILNIFGLVGIAIIVAVVNADNVNNNWIIIPVLYLAFVLGDNLRVSREGRT